MSSLVERYVFKTSAWAFCVALGVLTAMIWVTQALREFDLLTTKGQSILIFFGVTGLTVPSLIIVIAPIALFIAVLYSLNKLNSDSELIVMTASGLSPVRLMRPFATLTMIVVLLVASMSLLLNPWSFRTLRDLVTQIRADFITRVVREGSFTSLEDGFVFHYRERGPNGELLGIFMQDRRDPQRTATYLAERGQTADVGDSDFLVLEKGSVQRQQAGARDANIVVFDRYAIDLAQFGPDTENTSYRPRERSTREILGLNPDDPAVKPQIGRLRTELHDRFVNPLFAMTFGMIAFAALGQARTTRQGRGVAMLVAVIAVLAIRLLGFMVSNHVSQAAAWVPFMYLVPLLGFAVALAFVFRPQTWPFSGISPRRRPIPSTA